PKLTLFGTLQRRGPLGTSSSRLAPRSKWKPIHAKKTAFVTGGTGFIGLNLVEHLTQSGWNVVASASSQLAVDAATKLSRPPSGRDDRGESLAAAGHARGRRCRFPRRWRRQPLVRP